MDTPKISVIIPTYKGANLLVEAIQSVLDQTYPHFELIVVDDASPDNTMQAVTQFNDPRLKYIRHKENQGVNKSRLTGIDASSGEIVTWLDQDDLFHPKKFEMHVAFLMEHPDVGISYNSRFELNHSSMTIRDLWRLSRPLKLCDFVLGFPISPSDMVFTRYWANRKDLWEDNYGISGGEIPFTCRLKFEGCQFGFVDQALNYRRHHTGRIFPNLSALCESELECQELVFDDPRCPPEVLAIKDIAFMNTYLVWSGYAFLQHETSLAQDYLRKAIELNQGILDGNPCGLVREWVRISVADNSLDHESLLRDIFTQLPAELAWLSGQQDWAVAQGYLEKGTRAVIWDRPEEGMEHFDHARRLNAHIGDLFLRELAHSLLNFEHEFGSEAVRVKLQQLAGLLKQFGGHRSVRQLKGYFLVNSAFRDYHAGNFQLVPKNVLAAITNTPGYIANRGVLSILLRASFGRKLVQ